MSVRKMLKRRMRRVYEKWKARPPVHKYVGCGKAYFNGRLLGDGRRLSLYVEIVPDG